MALLLTSNVHGKGGHAAADGSSVADYGNSFNPGSQERTLDRRSTHATRYSSPPKIWADCGAAQEPQAAHHQHADGQELIAELNSLEVDFTSAGNMVVDVRRKDHHGGLVIATALALWSAVGRPSGRIEVGTLEN